MKRNFYPKLAWTGIAKNKRLYIPYLLTCVCVIMMFYIISALCYSDLIYGMRGGRTLTQVLSLGRGVVAVFSLIFLFYTSSFLVRRRKKEFGLYNILGMSKGNISRIMLWETGMIALSTLVVGLALGLLLEKFAELALVNMIRGEVSYHLTLSFQSLVETVEVYCVIFLLILLNSLRQVRLTNPLELLHSENHGEKPPKANWVLAVAGVVLLGIAYYLAVTIVSPLKAMMTFFGAVILVIVATYLIFIAGSVAFCRLLQRKKGYYYKPNHFVSVSSMVYRMKRNGAGLASICILSTMVLVILSSTVSLYVGMDDSLKARYPRDVSITLREYPDTDVPLTPEALDEIGERITQVVEQYGKEPEKVLSYRSAVVAGYLRDGKLEMDYSTSWQYELDSYENVCAVYLVPLSDYNRIMGTNETLTEDEALVYGLRMDYSGETLQIGTADTLRVKKVLEDFWPDGTANTLIVPALFVVVSDFDGYLEPLYQVNYNSSDAEGINLLEKVWNFNFDLDVTETEWDEMFHDLYDVIAEACENGLRSFSIDDGFSARSDFYSTYGGLLFLGILLSLVFLFAAVLIIYYKQLSEGYEDQSRFDIMQKVGMTRREIQRSINSQVLTVFFLPLLFSGLHLAFAFPMVFKILQMLNLNNRNLFLACNGGSFLIFALFYVVVYRLTSRAYYHIVVGAQEH